MERQMLRELSLEEAEQVAGGMMSLLDWALGEVLTRSLERIWDTARTSSGGNSDMSSWQAP